MHEKERRLGVARDKRIGDEVGERIVQIFGFRARNWDVEQELRHLFRREPGKALQQAAAGLGQLRDRGLPCDGDGASDSL